MTTLTPLYSVLDRMNSLRRAVDSAMQADDMTPGWETGHSRMWLPLMDTYETEGAFVLEADLPGVHPENVDISFEQNTLTIKGMRAPTIQANTDRKEVRVFASERFSGSFARAVRLPEYVDGDKIEASYHNGVLTVTVPKAAAAKPRKISITSSIDGK